MRASWTALLRVCREVAYGINAITVIRHGKQPGVPPYPPPSVFSTPSVSLPGALDRPPAEQG